MNYCHLIETEADFERLISRLNEGVEDPGILKAIFMAGGPGSGKSAVAGELFDLPNPSGFAPSGLRVVGSDPAFEANLKKMGIDPKTLHLLPKEQFDALTQGADSPRGRAKVTKNSQQGALEIGRIGMLFDQTGDDYGKIKKRKARLEEMGYDVYMLFINTSLEKALERNLSRPRSLPEDQVAQSWSSVQQNLGKFKSLFKNNFHLVDNTELDLTLASKNPSRRKVDFKGIKGAFNSRFLNKMKKITNAIMVSPVKNQIGIDWIKAQKGGTSLRAEKMRKTESVNATDLIHGVLNGSSAEDTIDQLM